jgi:hypothetical protein
MEEQKKLTKFQQDFLAGYEWRKEAIEQINKLFEPDRYMYYVRFLHEGQSVRMGDHIARNNTIGNRILDRMDDKGIGLELLLIDQSTYNTKQLILRKFTDGDVFLKKPSDVSPEDYLKRIRDSHSFLYLDDDFIKFGSGSYVVLPMKELLADHRCQFLLSDSPGNKTRMSLYSSGRMMVPSTFLKNPTNGGNTLFGFTPPLAHALSNLFKG